MPKKKTESKLSAVIFEKYFAAGEFVTVADVATGLNVSKQSVYYAIESLSCRYPIYETDRDEGKEKKYKLLLRKDNV